MTVIEVLIGWAEGPGADVPLNVTVPVCGPTLNPEEFAVIMTDDDAFPVWPFVSPVASAAGETVNQGALALAVHVSVDPGAPVFVIVTDPFAVLPAAEVNERAVGVALISATGSQSNI